MTRIEGGWDYRINLKPGATLMTGPCPSCTFVEGPCQRGGLPGLRDPPEFVLHGWKQGTSGHLTFCDAPTAGTCTTGRWCDVTCRECWKWRGAIRVQLSLFGD